MASLTAAVDLLLGGLSLFHLFVGLTFVIPADHMLKKPGVHHHLKAARALQCLPLRTLLVALAALALYLCHLAHNGSGSAVRAAVASYTWLCAVFLRRLSEVGVSLGEEKVLLIEHEAQRADIAAFQPPPARALATLMAPIEALIRPDITGLEHVTETPSLYVMNHSLLGVEMPSFIHALYSRKGVFLRGLADHMHFSLPHGEVLRALGAVDGTRENVDVLMGARQNVLVYPGGAHEVLKHSATPKYSLLWKQRLGFARMAIKHGYPLVPCAAVGTEDMLSIVADLPVGFVRKELSLPLAAPPSPARIQKIYFWFGEPIPTAQFGGDWQNDAFAIEVRDRTRAAVESGIAILLEKQETDPDRFLMERFGARVREAAAAAAETFEGLLRKAKEE